MNHEKANKAIKNVLITGIVISLFFIITSIFILCVFQSPDSNFNFKAYIITSVVIMVGILDLLVFGVYKFKSRVCAILLLLGTTLMVIGVLATGGKTPLLIDGILIYIYYKGIRATFYLNNNKLADSE